MDNIFTTLLTLSWQAGVIALAVALVRLPLRRAPRWAVCALWAPPDAHRLRRRQCPDQHRRGVPDPYAAVDMAHRRRLYAALYDPQLPADVG